MKAFEFSHDYENYFNFKDVLEICKDYTSYFTMTEQLEILNQLADNKKLEYRNFMKAMEPFLIKKFNTTEWYCYYVTDFNKLTINVFEFNEKTKNILNSYIDNLFFRAKNKMELLNIPEDICFFRKDKTLFLGTVSHESIAKFYLSNQEIDDIKLPIEFNEVDKILDNYYITLPI